MSGASIPFERAIAITSRGESPTATRLSPFKAIHLPGYRFSSSASCSSNQSDSSVMEVEYSICFSSPIAYLLQLLAVLQRPRQGEVVRILQVTAHGQPAGQAGDAHAEGLQKARNVHGRRFAFQ